MQSEHSQRKEGMEQLQGRATQLEQEQQEASSRFARLDSAHSALLEEKVGLAAQLEDVQAKLQSHRHAPKLCHLGCAQPVWAAQDGGCLQWSRATAQVSYSDQASCTSDST